MRTLILAVIPALALGACADYGGPNRHMGGGPGDDMARLQRQCDARGGILVPSGRLTGQPSLDNVCKISGGGTNLRPADR